MSETAFRRRVQAALEREGAWILKLHGTRFGRSGTPDLLVISPVWTGLLEIKAGRNPLSPAQRHRAREIVRAGGRFFVLRDTGRFTRVEDHDGRDVGSCSGLLCLEDLRAFALRLRR